MYNIYIYIYIYKYVCVCICICKCMYIYIYIYTHTYISARLESAGVPAQAPDVLLAVAGGVPRELAIFLYLFFF